MEPVVGGLGTQASADGASFCLRDWRGSGPAVLHVDHDDDEAWHVLAAALRFRFADRTVEAQVGTTVLCTGGRPHTSRANQNAVAGDERAGSSPRNIRPSGDWVAEKPNEYCATVPSANAPKLEYES
jgi:hypothetical protein